MAKQDKFGDLKLSNITPEKGGGGEGSGLLKIINVIPCIFNKKKLCSAFWLFARSFNTIETSFFFSHLGRKCELSCCGYSSSPFFLTQFMICSQRKKQKKPLSIHSHVANQSPFCLRLVVYQT